MIIRPIQCIWILFLLCHTACNGCKQYEIEKENIAWGAEIAINSTSSGGGVTPLGSINGFPVLSLSGTISKNVPGVDTAFLCAIFVPDGDTPDAGAKEIQGHTVKSDAQDTSSNGLALGQLHALNGGGFVYYERPLNPEETGSVDFSVASLDADHSLALGTTYNIYLGIKVGPHFFYSDNNVADYTLPDTTSLTQITVDSAQCDHGRDACGKVLPELSANATVTNQPGSGTAGFLYVKQGTDHTPSGLFAKQLAPGSTPLPTMANTLTAHIGSDVVLCPVALDPNVGITSLADTHGVLEKGATYDVYGYVQDGNNYFVSDNSQAVTLPAVEIQVSMEGVGAPSLLATATATGYNVHDFSLEVTGKITKLDNAKDPVAGFVFVEDGQSTDKADICQKISGAISDTSTEGHVENVAGKNYVVCIAKVSDVDTVQTITYACDLKDLNDSKLDLNSNYTVHCWVKDAKGNGELFLSDNNQPLEVFYAESGNISSVKDVYEGRRLTIEPGITIGTLHNDKDAEMAIFFVNASSTTGSTEPDLGTLRTELKARRTALEANSKGNIPGWLPTSTLPPCYVYNHCTGGKNSEIRAENNQNLAADTRYALGLVMRKGDVLYYAHLAGGVLAYKTPIFFTSTPQYIEVSIGDKKYELDAGEGKIFHVEKGGSKQIITNEQTARAVIEEYTSDTDTQEELMKKYQQAMAASSSSIPGRRRSF